MIVRTVGFGIEAWFFPEFDQWQLSCRRPEGGRHRILAIGPLRFRFSTITINR